MLITISRQYAAGDLEVANEVARGLGWTVVDSAFIAQVAARAGLPPEEVARHEERIPSFMERLARVTAHAFPELFATTNEPIAEFEEEKLVKITRNLVTELADEGRMVLVGRAAAAVLARKQDVLYVRLVAPREFRIRLAADHLGVDAAEAKRVLTETDTNWKRYHENFYDRDWDDATHYHMVLNTELLGFAGAAKLIVAEARARGW